MPANRLPGGGMSRREIVAAMALGALDAALPGSAAMAQAPAGWDDVLAKAEAEGEVFLYSARSDADNAALLDAFTRKYPKIGARSLRLVSGAMATRVDQEERANAIAADVLQLSESQWIAAKVAAGFFETARGPALQYWAGAEKYYNSGPVLVSGEPWVIGFNTNLVKPAPSDWDSLIADTRFTGRFGLNEVTGITHVIWSDFVEKKKPGYFEKLALLRPRLYPNSAPLTAALSSGELAWAPYSLPSSIEPLKKAGAPVDYVVPQSGTWALERHAMVPRAARRRNAGLVLLDFMMSPEGQQILNGQKAGFTFAPGIHLTDGLEVDLKSISSIDYLSYGKDDIRVWQQRYAALRRQ